MPTAVFRSYGGATVRRRWLHGVASDQSRADQHRIVALSAVELCRRFVNTIDYRPKILAAAVAASTA